MKKKFSNEDADSLLVKKSDNLKENNLVEENTDDGVPEVSRKPLGGLQGPAGGVPSSQSYPRAQASSLSAARPVQGKTRVTSPCQVQPHPEMGKKRGQARPLAG